MNPQSTVIRAQRVAVGLTASFVVFASACLADKSGRLAGDDTEIVAGCEMADACVDTAPAPSPEPSPVSDRCERDEDCVLCPVGGLVGPTPSCTCLDQCLVPIASTEARCKARWAEACGDNPDPTDWCRDPDEADCLAVVESGRAACHQGRCGRLNDHFQGARCPAWISVSNLAHLTIEPITLACEKSLSDPAPFRLEYRIHAPFRIGSILIWEDNRCWFGPPEIPRNEILSGPNFSYSTYGYSPEDGVCDVEIPPAGTLSLSPDGHLDGVFSWDGQSGGPASVWDAQYRTPAEPGDYLLEISVRGTVLSVDGDRRVPFDSRLEFWIIVTP